MSLVGTRPPTLDEWEKYEPHHRARMSFRSKRNKHKISVAVCAKGSEYAYGYSVLVYDSCNH